MKIIAKQLGFYLIFLVLLIFICSLLNLIGLNSTVTNLILFIFNALAFLLLGFKNGIKSNIKGYYAGLKIGACMLLILFLINLIVAQKVFSLSLLIYYLVLILCAILGGMFGKAKKKEEN